MIREHIKAIYKKTFEPILEWRRKSYRGRVNKRLKASVYASPPSIIASDCVAGIIYHDCALRFCSPTINLYFSKEDYILFAEHLQGFLSAELREITDTDFPYPLGRLEYNGMSVELKFMHYSTFAEAAEKWEERKKRVDFSNLIFVWIISVDLQKEDVERFERLPYKRKMIITYDNPTDSKLVVVSDLLKKRKFRPGQILEYKRFKLSVKRYLDDIDYISLLNEEPDA